MRPSGSSGPYRSERWVQPLWLPSERPAALASFGPADGRVEARSWDLSMTQPPLLGWFVCSPGGLNVSSYYRANSARDLDETPYLYRVTASFQADLPPKARLESSYKTESHF